MTGSSPEELQASLGTAYVIERELGRGGMATVYLARDTKHRRPVALKVLLPDLAASLGPERFRREITTVAQLQHPHILGVHDSGETGDGQLWFTMPYVEGESLRARLARDRQLPIGDAIRITREIAGALDYAHEAGVLHRDIKPENILLTKRGDALLADFGIARALREGASITGEQRIGLTMTGLAVGTPQYMSPEQAAGDHILDARSDVYALGAVCYEMLAGEPPFTGPSQQAVIAKMMSTDAPSVRVLRPGVSAALDDVLRRALARVPGDRWKSAGEFGAALDAAERGAQGTTAAQLNPTTSTRRPSRIAAVSLGAGFMIGVGLLFAWSSRGHNSAQSASGAIRLAVLPFENVGDTSDAYFADGVTDAVRGKLTGLPGIEVIGSASSGQYRKTTKTPQQIGQELGVRYLLIGRVHWARGPGGTSRVQVSPELIDAGTAAAKWQQSFDAPLTDVFQVQGDIASKVAQSLQVALTPAAKQDLASSPTKDLVAYDSYLRGLALQKSGNSPAALRRALKAYNEAIARDSDFALAWSGAGREYGLLYTNGIPSPALADSADKATARALALRQDLADAHGARSSYYANVKNDFVHALEETKAGLATTRTAPLLSAATIAAESLGDWEAAAAYAAEAIRVDPRDAAAFSRQAELAMWRRDTATARNWTARASALLPGNLRYLEASMIAELQRGDLAAARRLMREAPATVDPSALVTYVATYYDLGWTLDSAQDKLLLSLGPDAFDDDSSAWGLVRAEQYWLHGDQANTRIAAQIALSNFDEQLKLNPDDQQRHLLRGLTLALLGRGAEAFREGERGKTIGLKHKDEFTGPYFDQLLARIYMLSGKPELAINVLEQILHEPYYLTPSWLRIDPTFAPLRGNARFERLVAGGKAVA